MLEYVDGLGYKYTVAPHQIEEFERRRGVLLRIAIFLKLVILMVILIWAWSS